MHDMFRNPSASTEDSIFQLSLEHISTLKRFMHFDKRILSHHGKRREKSIHHSSMQPPSEITGIKIHKGIRRYNNVQRNNAQTLSFTGTIVTLKNIAHFHSAITPCSHRWEWYILCTYLQKGLSLKRHFECWFCRPSRSLFAYDYRKKNASLGATWHPLAFSYEKCVGRNN